MGKWLKSRSPSTPGCGLLTENAHLRNQGGPPPTFARRGRFFFKVSPLFVNVQIPFADARQFVEGETGRLKSPTWPLPDPGNEFVRNCGRIEVRRRGGIAPWSGEGTYCDARRAIRFPDSLGRIRFPAPERDIGLDGVYRRYLSTGLAMSRLDIGLRPLRLRDEPSDRMSADFMNAVLRACTTVPVRVGGEASGGYVPLVTSTSRLARHVLDASTAVAAIDKTEEWWFSAGRPMVLVEYWVDQFPRLPRPRREVSLEESLALRLSHFYMRVGGSDVGVWLLGYGDQTDRDAIRRMRVHLSRLHAEREGLRKILAQIARGRLSVNGTSTAELLGRYLNDTCRAVTRANWYGNAQHPLLEAAYASDALVSEGDRESLLGEVENTRRVIASKVRQVAEPIPPRSLTHITCIGSAEKVIVAGTLEELDMSDKRV